MLGDSISIELNIYIYVYHYSTCWNKENKYTLNSQKIFFIDCVRISCNIFIMQLYAPLNVFEGMFCMTGFTFIGLNCIIRPTPYV